jgi:hypothetical protein
MDNPLLTERERERNPPPKKTKESLLILIPNLFIAIISIIALFVALNNYLVDQPYRTFLASQSELLQDITLINQRNEYVIAGITNKGSQLDDLQTQCNNVVNKLMEDEQTLDNGVQPTFDLYIQINNTINTQDVSCNNQLDLLNQTFNWLINSTIQNSTTIYNGKCRFNSLAIVGQDIDIDYKYKLLDLNGVDFYFYEFTNSTATIDASMGVKIEGCSPRIFVGQPNINKALNTEQLSVSSFTTGPLSMSDYISHVEFGSEYLQIIPKSTPSVNQTLAVNVAGFRLWTNVLF